MAKLQVGDEVEILHAAWDVDRIVGTVGVIIEKEMWHRVQEPTDAQSYGFVVEAGYDVYLVVSGEYLRKIEQDEKLDALVSWADCPWAPPALAA